MRALVCLLLLVGCYRDAAPVTTASPPVVEDGGGPPAPERSWKRVATVRACDDAASYDCVMQKFGEFRDRACGCAAGDRMCGEAIMTDLNQWTTEMSAQVTNNNLTPTPEQSKMMADVATEFSNCLSKAIAPPSSPPPMP